LVAAGPNDSRDRDPWLSQGGEPRVQQSTQSRISVSQALDRIRPIIAVCGMAAMVSVVFWLKGGAMSVRGLGVTAHGPASIIKLVLCWQVD
jgi:hypothetical protein